VIDTDADIRRGLRVAGARLKVEAPPVPRVIERGRRGGRSRALAVAAGMLTFLVAAGLVGRLATSGTTPDRRAALPAPEPAEVDEELREALSPPPEPDLGVDEPVPWRVGRGGAWLEGFTATGGFAVDPHYAASTSAVPPDVDTPLQTQGRVVKHAELEVQVPAGDFGDVYAQAQRLAAANGGFVHEAETEGERARSGLLVIRIPAEHFEEALADLKDLGVVVHEKVSGQDVTSDFIDLRARLRNWLAQEQAVRRFLAEARTLEETLRIHGQLQEIEVQIEHLKGNLRVLRDRSGLGTVSLELREEGVVVAAGAREPGVLSLAWHQALAGATDVLAAVMVGLGYLVPILLLLALAWLAFRAMRPRAAA